MPIFPFTSGSSTVPQDASLRRDMLPSSPLCLSSHFGGCGQRGKGRVILIWGFLLPHRTERPPQACFLMSIQFQGAPGPGLSPARAAFGGAAGSGPCPCADVRIGPDSCPLLAFPRSLFSWRWFQLSLCPSLSHSGTLRATPLAQPEGQFVWKTVFIFLPVGNADLVPLRALDLCALICFSC